MKPITTFRLPKLKRFVMKPITTFMLLAAISFPCLSAKLKDISSLTGVRTNSLSGYGLVIGLDGSGDRGRLGTDTLRNLLDFHGLSLQSIDSRNVAAVMVTAELPSFAKPGQKLDVVVSSVGNAKSLYGGQLINTPLQAIDGQVYAMAQGTLITGLGASGDDGSEVTIGVKTSGSIANGAVVEGVINSDVASDGFVYVNLRHPSYANVSAIIKQVNVNFGDGVAMGLDNTSIKIMAPAQQSSHHAAFMAALEELDIELTPAKARVVVNSRSGSVVITGNVELSPAAVTFGRTMISISNNTQVSQPGPFSEGRSKEVVNSAINIEQTGGLMHSIPKSRDLQQLVTVINAMGLVPDELVGLLEALARAGSLQAELIIL